MVRDAGGSQGAGGQGQQASGSSREVGIDSDGERGGGGPFERNKSFLKARQRRWEGK